ncbi:site-specific integrase [Neorhizobium galegae]|uniref:site-specific integrase n=1 Tax=Neorhizobium galegae TaxID=399 RepID=UPI0006217390|nr:site-specific integrase [Neorhizobium galegae]KAB1125575.1 site-specific integrase [Neorhizobium galegae]MCQ1805834.1 site-specific integrase [Neorhizobium galegae]CDZ59587.1 Shufflon-specific DNA recombinase [Neorhizobium galegae bv. orientalis]
MGTITARKRKNGSVGYRARLRVMRDGVTYHETETFDRRPAAAAWMKKRERELAKPGAIAGAIAVDPTLAKAIDRYTEESIKDIGRTKAQVLKSIKTYDIAKMPCSTIKSKDIIEFLQSLTGKPQTVGNYASHLAAVFAIARPMWDFRLDEQEMKDAIKVARRMGIISRSIQRSRRPTLEELDLLLGHFIDRRKKIPQAVPMHKVIVFALFSARRQEEITRVAWNDFQKEHKRILVRDMKHPGEKIGNDMWVDLPDEAVRIIDSMPGSKPEIFPYSTDAITANFTRACKLLDIKDLRFHDLRHEGVSRLFEMGWNIPHVAAVSGHRSWVSLKRYTHIRETGDKYAGWHGLQLAIDTK